MTAAKSRAPALLALVTLVGLAACSSSTPTPPSSTPASTPATTTTTAAGSSTTSTIPTSLAPYLGLWPFRTSAEVEAWKSQYQPGGDTSWHLDAAVTALRFSTDFLGYGDVNVAVGTVTDHSGAHVSVGFRPKPGQQSVAAVVHLVRWGSGEGAPWEVVGTDDTTFSITMPAYGTTATSPLRVGGRITGVDESIRLLVHQPSSAAALGTSCCLPAGGSRSPWSALVGFTGATDPVLTVSASTGGHLQAVERFAVTAVKSPPAPR